MLIDSNKIYKDVLAWKISIPNMIDIDWENLDYKLQDGTLFENIKTRYENNNNEIKKQIYSLLDLDIIKEKIPDYNTIDIKIFKDLPGFKLFPHIDKREHKGFIMINLIDNVNSTTFFNFEKKFLFESSNKKNEGVFHILHGRPFTLHAIENTSNKNRYTTIAFIK